MRQCLAWGSLSILRVRAWAALPPPMLPCHTRAVADLGERPRPSHISKMVLPIVQLGPPGEARTPRKDRCAKDHRAPSHISKTVLSTVHLGPPEETRTPVRVASPGITGHLATIRRRFCLQWKKAPLPTYIHLHRVLRRLSDAEGGRGNRRTRRPGNSHSSVRASHCCRMTWRSGWS